MNHRERIAVCGLGYVGYPVSLLLARAGYVVTGLDIDKVKVASINRWEIPIKGKEPGLVELVKEVKSLKKFSATTDVTAYKNSDIIIIAVETPVEHDTHEPSYKALRACLADIGTNMKKGALVVIESTIAPGTIERVAISILESKSGLKVDKDFYVANCPERLMPGYLIGNITDYNRVLGGHNRKALQIAKNMYKNIVKGELDEVDCITAELVKTVENTYRDVQIAFANEVALACEKVGANVWEVRQLVNKCRKLGETRPEAMRQMHFPGAGVGGHCIPKDPWLFIYGVKNQMKLELVEGARCINNSMPLHMVDLLKQGLKEAGKTLKTSRIVVLGYAYNGNSDDARNTPSQDLISDLKKQKVKFSVHDSFIKEYKVDLKKLLKGCDALVLMTAHDEYTKLNLKNLKQLMKAKPVIVDGRNVFNKQRVRRAGFIYKGVGNV